MKRLSLSALVLLTAIGFALSAAAESGAIVAPMGASTRINGRVLTSPAHVGTTAVTAIRGAAMIEVGNSTVTTSDDSVASIHSGAVVPVLVLASGSARVRGAVAIRVSSGLLSPRGYAIYRVVVSKGEVRLTVGEGAVEATGDTGSHLYPVGSSVTVAQAPAAVQSPSGSRIAVPLAIGLAVAAAVITGIIVHQATKCDNCVPATQAAPSTPAASTP